MAKVEITKQLTIQLVGDEVDEWERFLQAVSEMLKDSYESHNRKTVYDFLKYTLSVDS